MESHLCVGRCGLPLGGPRSDVVRFGGMPGAMWECYETILGTMFVPFSRQCFELSLLKVCSNFVRVLDHSVRYLQSYTSVCPSFCSNLFAISATASFSRWFCHLSPGMSDKSCRISEAAQKSPHSLSVNSSDLRSNGSSNESCL